MALREDSRQRPAANAMLLLIATSSILALCTMQTQAYKYLEGALIETMDMKPFLSDAPEGHVCYEADVIYHQNTFSKRSASTPKICQTSCATTSPCFFWSWDSVTLTCHLKHGPAARARERSSRSQGFISGPKTCTMPFPMRCYEVGVNFVGHTIYESNRCPSAYICHERCVRKTECIYWSWDEDKQQCFMKDVGALKGWTKSTETQNMISGMRACGPCVELGVDYRGSDVERIHSDKIPVAEECRRRCMRHPGCFFWTWVRDHKGCYLKGLDALKGRFQDELTANMVSGSKFCPMDRDLRIMLMNNIPWASRDFFVHSSAPCYEEGVEYENDELFAIADRSTTCAHDCHKRCRETKNCEYWSFNVRSLRCSLKNNTGKPQKRRDGTTVDFVSGAKDCPCSETPSGHSEL